MQMPLILAVDDEPIILMGTEALCRSLGYDVVTAAGVKSALNSINDNRDIGILLTDLEMPLFSGAELAAQARNLRPDLGVILVSGRLELDDQLQPGWASLLKPYTSEELAFALQSVNPLGSAPAISSHM